MLYEFCAENFEHIEAALAAGAGRIELCDNLAVGGTTPSLGVIEQAVALVHARADATARAIIRPRGGNFVYSEPEFRAMETDIRMAAANGIDGVVIGCLTARAGSEDGKGSPSSEGGATAGFELDRAGIERLVRVAQSVGEMRGRELGITFHMAFDALTAEDQPAAIDTLAELGVDHVLTHGGPAGTPIEDNLEHLRGLIAHAAGRLTILPGGGITYKNAPAVAETLGVTELHGTKVVRLA